MKDKALRKALGLHGGDTNPCGCDIMVCEGGWSGEIPTLFSIKVIEHQEWNDPEQWSVVWGPEGSIKELHIHPKLKKKAEVLVGKR